MAKKIKIYCIPGLGLDHRLFAKLNIPVADLHFIDWIKAKEKENIKDYAARFAEKLPIGEDVSLMGVSLGGIIAIEIAQIRKIEKLFLISTVKDREEMPRYMSWLQILPEKNEAITKLGIDASIKLKSLYDNVDSTGNRVFKEMVESADVDFINWGYSASCTMAIQEKIKNPFYTFPRYKRFNFSH